jgi:hypothetical protein
VSTHSLNLSAHSLNLNDLKDTKFVILSEASRSFIVKLHDEVRGARAELVKAVNDMRKNGEELDDGQKHRILAFCYNPTVTNPTEPAESLSAVPVDDAWKTYLWLDDAQDEETEKTQSLSRDFIYANLLEVSGKRTEALEKYRVLQRNPQTKHFTFKDRVDDAVKRLSQD